MKPVCTAYDWNFKPTYLALSTPAADHPIRRADGAVYLVGNPTRITSGIFGTLSFLARLPRVAALPCPSGWQGPRPPLLTNGKYPNTNAYDFTVGTLVPISFETDGYAHPDTISFFTRYIKYGMSDGTATEPVWTTQTRTEYVRRMHVVRTTLSIAIARTTANTLLYGATTLLVADHT